MFKKVKLNKLSRKLYPDAKIDGDHLLVNSDEPIFTAPFSGVYSMDYNFNNKDVIYSNSVVMNLDQDEEFDVSFKDGRNSRFQIIRLR